MKAAVIGRGNVGTHLAHALAPGNESVTVAPRTLEGLPNDADIYLISVPDDAIPKLAERLHALLPDALVAHTSGTTGIDVLLRAGFRRAAVFYPLQTFSRDVDLDYSRIPLFLEAASEEDMPRLEQLALTMSEHIFHAGSEQRRRLHLASVLACNFVNHLWDLAYRQLDDAGLPPDVIRPLIEETTAKLSRLDPHDGQTGPARRGDSRTVARHLEMLADDPSLQKIYSMLSDSIYNTYHSDNERH